MKASPHQQKELLRLQALDIKVVQVTHQMTALPQHSELTLLQREADSIRAKMTTEGGALDDVRTELGRIESDVSVVEKRIARDTERAQHTSSIKEVQAYEAELTALRKRLFDLEEIEIAVMERLEQHEASVAVVVAEREALAERVSATEKVRDESLEDLNRQLGELKRDRVTVATSIEEELVALYEKRRVTGRGNAAALLRARTCSGCTMTLTGNDLAEVRQAAADEVLFCPDCGAILVRTDESGI
ncbi:hypothetical protein JF66_02085 [Cryobacterium sp. MLB-32]|uniref:zinc ribbon domain-containing protein n=1 Tax=Cryobacterium sp. MLB-32 TaxID=1529318 RepID=UPI0004E6C0E1|nr:C4-type zinc ribbon domain-containing protein [Cryobacterium sp. MLB-32]KFF60790.1 hypothetical protein JF66_02085 [Cryobacterium sp. MLB-32]